MNKITRKQNSLYCDNAIRGWYPRFKATPKSINLAIRQYHQWFDKTKKKKLGKAKRKNGNISSNSSNL